MYSWLQLNRELGKVTFFFVIYNLILHDSKLLFNSNLITQASKSSSRISGTTPRTTLIVYLYSLAREEVLKRETTPLTFRAL